jgi:hypothetical protein
LRPMRKVYANADEALAGQIKDGKTLMAHPCSSSVFVVSI